MKGVPDHLARYVGLFPVPLAVIEGRSCSTCGRTFRGKDREIRFASTGGVFLWHHWCPMPAGAVEAAEREEEQDRPVRERDRAILAGFAEAFGWPT